MVKYKPIFVSDKDRLPSMGASKLKRFLISNWSNGLITFKNVCMMTFFLTLII